MSDCPAQRCVLRTDNHKAHFDGKEWWPNEDFSPPAAESFTPGRKRSDRTSQHAWDKMSDIGRRVTPEVRVAGTETVTLWTEEQWVAHAWDVFMGFLDGREEPFTTPEHLWPLLPDPLPGVDRRALVKVVRRALTEKRIVEVGGKRLNDTYRTADGSEFPINKISPVYRRRA